MNQFKAKQQIDELDKLCVDLPILEARLRAAGLYKTGAALNIAVKKIGYEAADMREKLLKAKP